MILVPIHTPNHWRLAVVDVEKTIISLYDALDFSNEEIPKILGLIKKFFEKVSYDKI